MYSRYMDAAVDQLMPCKATGHCCNTNAVDGAPLCTQSEYMVTIVKGLVGANKVDPSLIVNPTESLLTQFNATVSIVDYSDATAIANALAAAQSKIVMIIASQAEITPLLNALAAQPTYRPNAIIFVNIDTDGPTYGQNPTNSIDLSAVTKTACLTYPIYLDTNAPMVDTFTHFPENYKTMKRNMTYPSALTQFTAHLFTGGAVLMSLQAEPRQGAIWNTPMIEQLAFTQNVGWIFSWIEASAPTSIGSSIKPCRSLTYTWLVDAGTPYLFLGQGSLSACNATAGVCGPVGMTGKPVKSMLFNQMVTNYTYGQYSSTGRIKTHGAERAPWEAVNPSLNDHLVIGRTPLGPYYNQYMGDYRNILSAPNLISGSRNRVDYLAYEVSSLQMPLVSNKHCGTWVIPPTTTTVPPPTLPPTNAPIGAAVSKSAFFAFVASLVTAGWTL